MKNRKNFNYYCERFPNVEKWALGRFYDKKRLWVLATLDKNLTDTRECHHKFFMFLATKMHKMGREAVLQIITIGVSPYQFIQESERRARNDDRSPINVPRNTPSQTSLNRPSQCKVLRKADRAG